MDWPECCDWMIAVTAMSVATDCICRQNARSTHGLPHHHYRQLMLWLSSPGRTAPGTLACATTSDNSSLHCPPMDCLQWNNCTWHPAMTEWYCTNLQMYTPLALDTRTQLHWASAPQTGATMPADCWSARALHRIYPFSIDLNITSVWLLLLLTIFVVLPSAAHVCRWLFMATSMLFRQNREEHWNNPNRNTSHQRFFNKDSCAFSNLKCDIWKIWYWGFGLQVHAL